MSLKSPMHYRNMHAVIGSRESCSLCTQMLAMQSRRIIENAAVSHVACFHNDDTKRQGIERGQGSWRSRIPLRRVSHILFYYPPPPFFSSLNFYSFILGNAIQYIVDSPACLPACPKRQNRDRNFKPKGANPKFPNYFHKLCS